MDFQGDIWVFRGVRISGFLFKMTQIWYIPPINLEVFSYPHFQKTPPEEAMQLEGPKI